jgi:uncharacterized RDD family membrane protein YckC
MLTPIALGRTIRSEFSRQDCNGPIEEERMHCSSCGAGVAEGTAFCGSCGRPIVGYNLGGYNVAASPVAPPVATLPGGAIAPPYTAAAGVTYAGFWLRVVASIIDGLVLGIPVGILFVATIASMIPALTQMGRVANPTLMIGLFLPRLIFAAIVYLAASWLYWALMESSSWQATLGKKALGLYVTDLHGTRASFGKTSGRFFVGRGIGALVGIYFLVDCILAGFTEKKQALHDIIVGTLVMRRV